MRYLVEPRLSEILKERNMTQLQLSKLTGIQQGTLSRFDRNRQHMDLHLVTILKVLEIQMEELFEITELDE